MLKILIKIDTEIAGYKSRHIGWNTTWQVLFNDILVFSQWCRLFIFGMNSIWLKLTTLYQVCWTNLSLLWTYLSVYHSAPFKLTIHIFLLVKERVLARSGNGLTHIKCTLVVLLCLIMHANTTDMHAVMGIKPFSPCTSGFQSQLKTVFWHTGVSCAWVCEILKFMQKHFPTITI
jgi:hypothetical protein